MKRKIYVKVEINVVKSELSTQLLAGSEALSVKGSIDGTQTFDYGGTSSNSADDGTGKHSGDAKRGFWGDNE